MSKPFSKSRRNFIGNSVKGSLAIGIGMSSAGSLLESCGTTKPFISTAYRTGFDQTPLPYKYDALENVIDATTMEIHYSKHAAAYSKNLKEALVADKADQTKSLEEILAVVSVYSSKLRNNGGGHYNHELFWKCMRPKQEGNMPAGTLLQAINTAFGSFDEFRKRFSDEGKNRFGSGWAWLYVGKNKTLLTGSTPNQDNPLMDIADLKGFPLLCLDVWEHAYYLKYQNKRADYIENWWKVVNWDYVQERFDKNNA